MIFELVVLYMLFFLIKELQIIKKMIISTSNKIPSKSNDDIIPTNFFNTMLMSSMKKLEDELFFIILSDPEDGIKIKIRMEVTAKLYRDRKLPVEIIELGTDNKFLKIFNSIAMADFAAYYTAMNYGLEPEEVPMVEEFKKMI